VGEMCDEYLTNRHKIYLGEHKEKDQILIEDIETKEILRVFEDKILMLAARILSKKFDIELDYFSLLGDNGTLDKRVTIYSNIIKQLVRVKKEL
jgi:hypothetical protein